VAKNEREILREWTTIVSAIDEGAGLDMVKAVGKKAGKYAPLGLGVGFGVADAAERLSNKDYAGAGIAGLSAAAGTVPGPGTAVAGALDAFNIARDQAKDAGGWKELGKKLQPSVSSAEQMPMEEHDLSEAGLISKLLTKFGKEAPDVAKRIDPKGNPLNPQAAGKAATDAAANVATVTTNPIRPSNISRRNWKQMSPDQRRAVGSKSSQIDQPNNATDVKSQSTDAAAKDPNAINFKKDVYNAAKTVGSDLYKGTADTLGSRPVKLVRNTAVAGGAGYLGLNALKKDNETAAQAANRIGQDIGSTASSLVRGTAQGVGKDLSQGEREAGIKPNSAGDDGDFKAADDDYKPGGARNPISNPLPDGSKGLDETRIFTRHPVSGQIVQLNVDNISRVVNQTFYESYECGAGDSAQWQCQIWSSTPVSKLLKGRS
jgi:hypothetical protein